MLGDEGLLQVDDLIGTEVSMEVRLLCVEDNDRAISASTSVGMRIFVSRRPS